MLKDGSNLANNEEKGESERYDQIIIVSSNPSFNILTLIVTICW